MSAPNRLDRSAEERTQGHAQVDICALNHVGEFLEADLAIAVLVGLHDGLVHDLLQLDILQVVAHHHLEHDEQLPVGNVAVAINVIDPEGKAQLLFLVTFGAKGRQTSHEFLEVDIATAVLIKDGDHSVEGCPILKRHPFKIQAFSLAASFFGAVERTWWPMGWRRSGGGKGTLHGRSCPKHPVKDECERIVTFTRVAGP